MNEVIEFINNYSDEMLYVFYNPLDLTEEQVKKIKETWNVFEVYGNKCVPKGKILVSECKNFKVPFVPFEPDSPIEDFKVHIKGWYE